ncbi:MAG TPA: thioesterase family protein [Candidatus Hydrogenedentes bacterium]|nr:thioesterase family protein [Candidatus Hydrogenedentota bacterium]HNT89211.1 thioesterase family protein [Candidatus Hydrogenedentota bacterium]
MKWRSDYFPRDDRVHFAGEASRIAGNREIFGMDGGFERVFTAGWGDMDFNGHMRNTAYLDLSGTVRMMYFEACGFSVGEFARLRFGPVIFRDDIEYLKEIRLLEQVRVTLELAGLGGNGTRFRVRNRFFSEDGRPAAVVTSIGGWLNLENRKLAPPPDALAEALRGLPRAEDFADL